MKPTLSPVPLRANLKPSSSLVMFISGGICTTKAISPVVSFFTNITLSGIPSPLTSSSMILSSNGIVASRA